MGDIDGFIQLIPGAYKSDRSINITSTDKVHVKYGCIDGSIVDGIREPFLYSFALDKPPGRKKFKETRIKLFKIINKPILSHINFYFEDDVHKLVDFNGETISFTCKVVKI